MVLFFQSEVQGPRYGPFLNHESLLDVVVLYLIEIGSPSINIAMKILKLQNLLYFTKRQLMLVGFETHVAFEWPGVMAVVCVYKIRCIYRRK